MSEPKWYVIMLPGEYPETSELYGPIRSEGAAELIVADWNKEYANPELDIKAYVLPVRSLKALPE